MLKRLFVAFVALLAMAAPVAAQAPERRLHNPHEIYRELAVDAAAVALVKDHFPAFFDYQDMVMFHPKFGYYSSGRVSFTSDYQTFPIVLAPAFGQMIAEHIFKMYTGMRAAGTLNETERFTIGEFGAGNGALAESILDHIVAKAKTDKDWAAFAAQVQYVCYDRSPALNEDQRKRNQRFGAMFDARVADATDLTATIKPGSMKGIFLSNELPDAFSVHKVILTPERGAEVAFVAPSISADRWQKIRPLLPAAIATQIEAGDATIDRAFFPAAATPAVYLSKATFAALLESMVTAKDYEAVVEALQFQEIYVPAAAIPELSAHLSRYAKVYADLLARESDGLLTYINTGVERMIHGSAAILAAGYVMTIDYGSSWAGILSQDGSSHLRTYGPAHREVRIRTDVGNNDAIDDIQTSDPYDRPTLNDLTTDVNFSLLDMEGRAVGLKTLFYGSQKALQSGTGISLDKIPGSVTQAGREDLFLSWAANFRAPGVFKLMVQQKDGTDPKYVFPDRDPEPLESNGAPLTAAQKERAAAIERRLGGR